MYFRSAPAAKNPGRAELMTSTPASPASNASSAVPSASTSGSPRALAGPRAIAKCITAPCWEIFTRPLLAIPVHRACEEHVARQSPAEDRLHLGRGGDQRRHIDPGLDSHLAEHRDQIFAGHVAGRPGGNRAPAEFPERRLEAR